MPMRARSVRPTDSTSSLTEKQNIYSTQGQYKGNGLRTRRLFCGALCSVFEQSGLPGPPAKQSGLRGRRRPIAPLNNKYGYK